MMCREEENGHWQKISQLQDRNKVPYIICENVASCQFHLFSLDELSVT
jgi:hypothetical protein